jgi:pimeloyl-ACP methyl ester carboxylesterase
MLLAWTVTLLLCLIGPAAAQERRTVSIRGHAQALRIYGTPTGEPVIVSSGDGGWMHVAPHVADFLAARGYFVIGFDVRAYLSSFTDARSTLHAEEEPTDYRVLVDFARAQTGKAPLLVGISEGAGLSLLAATDPTVQPLIGGVIGLGLPDMNELAWRWKDALIYLTHRAPDEPSFSAASVAARVSPVHLAAIHSTHDEFVPADEIARVMAAAHPPKRLWMVDAANHRFSNNQQGLDRALLEAIAWVREPMAR